MSGARVGGNMGPIRGDSFLLAFLEKGNEVANLDDSSFMGRRMERPLLSRVNTRSSLAKDLGVVVLAFPHLKPTATTWSERGKGEHVREGRRRAFAASSLLRDAWLGGAAPEAQARLAWLRGAAFETRPPVAESMPRLRGTAQLARVPVAELGPWPMETAHEAHVPFVELDPDGGKPRW